MTANVAAFDAAARYSDRPSRPHASARKALLARFFKHMFSGGAPIWHVATIGAVMTAKNERG